ncbi:MAG: hypothetical protein ACI4PF_02965, partial [Christensenellales bacterium]
MLTALNDSGKIVVLHSGNHDDRISRAVGVSTTKMAAEVAGVGEVFAPYFASTDLVLRQPLSPDGKFHFGVVSHHGTGISNVDGVFRLLRNVDNADLCVIGHTHQHSMKYERLINVGDDGQQVYHDVLCLTLPASGGGTYGAGMSMPDIKKQTAIWMAISSQPNPYAGKISPTGVKYPDIVPACAFFSPTNSVTSNIQRKRMNATKRAIERERDRSFGDVEKKIDATVDAIKSYEERIRDTVAKSITERRRKVPKDIDSDEIEMGE